MKWHALGFAALVVCAAACGGGESGSGGAAGADPEAVLPNGMTARQAIEARAHHMKDLGGSFKSVRDQLGASSPNLALVRVAAQEVQSASEDLPTWFPAGTGPETGVEMRAFAKVWSEPEKFASAAQHFKAEAASLNEIARGVDLDALRNQSRSVGKTCADCHESFREKKDE